MANIVENVKESMGRVVAWAKAHPKTAAGIAVVLIGIGVYLYIRARNAASTSGSTSQDLTTPGATTTTPGDTTNPAPITDLPTPDVINGPPTMPGTTTTTTTTTTPTIPLDNLGPIGGYDNTPVANNNLGTSGGSAAMFSQSQGVRVMTVDTSAQVGAAQLGNATGNAGASAQHVNTGHSGGSVGASQNNSGQSGGSVGASAQNVNYGQSGGSVGAVQAVASGIPWYQQAGSGGSVGADTSNNNSGNFGASSGVTGSQLANL